MAKEVSRSWLMLDLKKFFDTFNLEKDLFADATEIGKINIIFRAATNLDAIQVNYF